MCVFTLPLTTPLSPLPPLFLQRKDVQEEAIDLRRRLETTEHGLQAAKVAMHAEMLKSAERE